jgi:hypothetical protein
MPGSGLTMGTTLTACNCWSPHAPGVERHNRQEKHVPVQCNRPSGHEGNHMYLLRSFEKLAEWGQAEVYK